MLFVMFIIGKFFRVFQAMFNSLANMCFQMNPQAQMQLEFDRGVAQLKEGRIGLEEYRSFTDRVSRQVASQKQTVADMGAKVKAYLAAGDRESAGRYALELQKAQHDLAENQGQLDMHEKAYQNNLMKIQDANKKIGEAKTKMLKLGAELKMSAAEAEISKLNEKFDFNLTTDFGEAESIIQDKIGKNRAKARVSADLSNNGIVDIEHEQAMEKQLGLDALKQFEVSQGMASPETTPIESTEKQLGPVAVS